MCSANVLLPLNARHEGGNGIKTVLGQPIMIAGYSNLSHYFNDKSFFTKHYLTTTIREKLVCLKSNYTFHKFWGFMSRFKFYMFKSWSAAIVKSHRIPDVGYIVGYIRSSYCPLIRSLRRWASIKSNLVQRIVFAGKCCWRDLISAKYNDKVISHQTVTSTSTTAGDNCRATLSHRASVVLAWRGSHIAGTAFLLFTLE